MFQNLSVNFHLWQGCNMACGYCFNRCHNVRPDAASQQRITELLCGAGFSKISFVGGEPTMCPWLSELAKIAKYADVTTMLITNGLLLQEQDLSLFDWVGLSIDSFNADTNERIGRTTLPYHEVCDMVKAAGCRLKLNTVVSRYNITEDFNENIAVISPERWKVLQVLAISEQNNVNTDEFAICDDEFIHFLLKHREFNDIMCPEYNSDMTSSYIMVDPAGCFVDNSTGKYIKSQSILETDVETAFQQVNFSLHKYINRKGMYNWRTI